MYFLHVWFSRRQEVASYLSQKDNPLAVRPDDVIHLRAHPLPGQLRGPKACLRETRIDGSTQCDWVVTQCAVLKRYLNMCSCTPIKTGASQIYINSVCRLHLTLSTVSTSYHIDLSVGVAHVANNGAVFHPVQLVSGHHILVPYRKTQSFIGIILERYKKYNPTHKCFPIGMVSSGVTSACDDDINLTNDLIQLDHPESIHAEKKRGFSLSEDSIYY